jgi:hypothetical protein
MGVGRMLGRNEGLKGEGIVDSILIWIFQGPTGCRRMIAGAKHRFVGSYE